MMIKQSAIFAAFALSASLANAAVINEFSPNPQGSDPSTQSIELLGQAGESFSGYFISIESDSGASAGTVDRISQISGTFDSNGLLVVDIADLENPSFVTILSSSFSGSVGDNLDSNSDGILELNSLGTVYDALGVYDTDADNYGWAAALGGTDLAYIGSEPSSVFRDAISMEWYASVGGSIFDANAIELAISDFDKDPTISSFGDVNASAVPVPAAAWFFGSALLALAGFRRRK